MMHFVLLSRDLAGSAAHICYLCPQAKYRHLDPDRSILAGFVCVFLYLLHKKYQNLYSTRKVRTFLVSEDIFNACLKVKTLLG